MPEDQVSITRADAGPPAPSMPERLATAIRHAIGIHEPDSRHALQARVMAGFCAVLWSRFLRFDPASPDWPDRDRFIVSSPLYRVLPRIMAELSGQLPAPPAPEARAAGSERQAYGPNGQGLGAAIGMALAEQTLAARFGRSLVNHRVWALGCWTELSTGVALESAALAGEMGLDRVTLVVGLWQGERAQVDAILPRYSASGWSVRKVDAGNAEQIATVIASLQRTHKPCLIACIATPDTTPAPPVVDDPGLWAGAARRGASARRSWLRRLLKDRQKADFERMARNQRPTFWLPDWQRSWREHGATASRAAPPFAARRGLETLHELLPELTCLRSRQGMMADLSTVRRAGGEQDLSCGTQVNGMGALLNGIAIHGGLLACGASTIIAVDRMRPALRYAAMTGQQVIYLLTDDDMHRGESAGGWQPVEQLASLRAMPNMVVFRPADHRETMECMELALRRTDGPSLLTLESTFPLSTPLPEREQQGLTNLCARGGYVLAEADGPRQVTLVATGQEAIMALAARRLLRDEGIAAAVVSLPSWELFAAQKMTYRDGVLGMAPRIGIEAASGFGWERWLGPDGLFVGIDGFGAATGPDRPDSPADITPERICRDAMRLVRPVSASAPIQTAGGNNEAAPPGMASVDASV